MKTLPTLYKLASTGKMQMWSIGVKASTIVTVHGQVDGKQQRVEDVIKEGKNLGKTNETTPAEQALAEATSKWEGKIKKGYVEDCERAQAGEKDIAGGYDCMLAHKFVDHGHKIKYPAAEQPKLNGHRCLAIVDNGVCTLWSRTRKLIKSMPHIVKELEDAYPEGYHELDGELYNHSYKDHFEDLASIIRQEVPQANCTEVQYHIYDKNMDGGFAARYRQLEEDFKACEWPQYLVLTETVIVENEEEMIDNFERFLSLGYEGAMARNVDSPYEGKRSYHLQKIKEFQDAEFPIVGIKEGRAGYAGCGIFICKATNGETFDCKMRGPKERLKEFLKHPKLWKGKDLTVKYQYISAYGIPIFPVGERFKEDL